MLCNCGWKLRGSFKTLVDKPERSVTHQTVHDTSKQKSGLASRRQVAKEDEQAEKGNRPRERVFRHVYGKARSVSNFELTKTGWKRHDGLANNKGFSKPLAKSNNETFGMEIAVIGPTNIGNLIESREKTERRQEVHKWIQKNYSSESNANKEATKGEQGKDGNKIFQVYLRKGKEIRTGGKSDGEIKFREPMFKKNAYETMEYFKKLKGIQQFEHETESETESDSTRRTIGEWDRGESSTWEANEERALVPINQDEDNGSERISTRSRGIHISSNSTDIWRTTKDINLEEHVRIWIMRNILHMGESLGLRIEGRQEDMLEIAKEIQERSQVANTVSKKVKGISKGAREMNRLKSDINYERRGSRSTRKLSKVEKKRKGRVILC